MEEGRLNWKMENIEYKSRNEFGVKMVRSGPDENDISMAIFKPHLVHFMRIWMFPY